LCKWSSLVIVVLIIIELGSISWKENFFWRLDDNILFAQHLPASTFTAEALNTKRKGVIRSLYLEPYGTSVFKNRKHEALGPNASFWNTLQVATVPQVPNPVGTTWIFLNGPSFPKSDRMFRIRGGSKGITIKRYVVVPAGSMIPFFGIRCGSYATDAVVTFGDSTSTIRLDAHQQKIVELKPHNWTTNTVQQLDKQKVQIIPLTISLPHDEVWLSVLATQKEKDVFTLFGGGIEGKSLHAPLKEIPAKQEKQYFDALSHLRYLETSPSRKIKAGERITMWELPLPAGHYKLTCEVEGLADSSIIEL